MSPILPSAIIASSMFIAKYLLIYHLRDTLPSLAEIFEIFIVKIFKVNEISQQEWLFNESEDPNLVWSNWKTKFLRVVNSHAPFRAKRAKLNKTLWINSALEKGMRCRADAAIRKAIKTKNPLAQYRGNYRKLRNRINNKVKTTKASYYHKSFIQSKGNARRTGKTINDLMSRRQSNQIVKDVKVNDISICVSNEIFNAFNTFQLLGHPHYLCWF